jgi:hypothetical protein
MEPRWSGEPPEPENGGSAAETPINSGYLLRTSQITDPICWPQPQRLPTIQVTYLEHRKSLTQFVGLNPRDSQQFRLPIGNIANH